MKKSYFSIQVFNFVRFCVGKEMAKKLLFNFFYRKYYEQKSLLFVHIPKAAGTSIARVVYGKRVGHFSALELRGFLGNQKFLINKKFTVVRNPYDRLISAYNFAIQGGAVDGAVNNPALYKGEAFRTFKSFVTEWLVHQDLHTVELIFRPQYLFVYEGENCLVDYVGKVEALGELEQWLIRALGKTIEIPHTNRSKQSMGAEHLDQSTADVVYALYKTDFEKFNYSAEWLK